MLAQQLSDAKAAGERLEAALAAQMAAAAEAAAKLASTEAVLAEERAGRAAAASNGESLQHDFDRLVAAGMSGLL